MHTEILPILAQDVLKSLLILTNVLIGECDSNKSHSHGMQHYHDRGTMNITGTLGRMYTHRAGQIVSGAFTVTNENYGGLEFSGTDTYSTYNFNASNSWTGKTSGSLANQTTGNTTTKTNTDSSGSTETKPINVSTKLWKRVS